MEQPGAIGYVLVNFDGIPVMKMPETLPAVQYAALISDLVMKTKSTLKQLN
jgi:predicted regulator of Ras-like GTPase activity (Roadblock/LC7/MglB family)|tara:strand:- start:372 stop:524 length:153 start_codon:yes stop_codon:yes gene_type:complete